MPTSMRCCRRRTALPVTTTRNNSGLSRRRRSDSRELFFVSDARKLYSLKVPEGGPSREIEPEFLFDMHANVANTRNSYIPSADGSRFLVHQVLDTEDAPINVISNWPAAIK